MAVALVAAAVISGIPKTCKDPIRESMLHSAHVQRYQVKLNYIDAKIDNGIFINMPTEQIMMEFFFLKIKKLIDR